MSKRFFPRKSKALSKPRNKSAVERRENATRDRRTPALRSCRFEDLEERHMMTASGWDLAQVPTLEHHAALDLQPELELHGALDTSAPADGCPDGYINVRDYDGNLLSNWQELLDADGEEFGGDHHGDGALPIGDDADASEIPIDSHYSLWSSKWPQSGGLGTAVNITYSYSNILDGTLAGINATQIKAAIEKVFQVWSTYAPLNFVEVADSGPAVSDSGYTAGSTPNIRIGYHYFDGPSQVLAHAYYPQGTQGLSGDVHFDSGDTWRIGAGAGGIDFVEVALHEVGHALGLQHENTATAIMNPYYGGRFANMNAANLLTDDIQGIRALYGSGTGSVTPIVVNHAPVLNAISNVNMSRSQNSVDVTLTATDSDNNPLTFSATASQFGAADQLAYQLDQQYGFSLSGGSDYYNYRGSNEKYVVSSSGQWYFMLPDGTLHQWSTTIANSPTIATLDSSFHTNLNKLYNAQSTANGSVNVGLTFNGNTLTVDPANGYTGTFYVTASVSDGNLSASRTFSVTVANQAPTLAAIADQSMRPTDDLKSVTLSYSDGDNDALTVTASVSPPDAVKATAYTLDQQYHFQAAPNEYYNLRGAGEKYFQNNTGSWYYVLSNGKVYSWGGSIAASTLISTLDSRFFTDVSLIYNAQPDSGAPNGVALSVSGNTLTVNPPNGYTGSFTVTVNVSDGLGGIL